MDIVRGSEVPFELRPEHHVVGTVWNKWYRKPADDDDILVAEVYFSPGARSRWHRHVRGHVLYVTDGAGLIKERGGKAQRIAKGDVVIHRDNVWHWHGATPDTMLVHFAVTPEQPNEWAELVTDEEYAEGLAEIADE